MPLDTIIGHESQLQALLADKEADNVAHAYLFAGRKHLGKFTVAKRFAQELLTVDAESDEEKMRLGHDIDRLLHPDLFVIDRLWIEDVCEDFEVIAKSSNVPQQDRMKNGAKTDTIGIDDIRALQERLHEVSGGRYRCCLIRSAERLHEEAVNALLKILEEPPPGVVFLLTTESLPQLLPTLISRSRVLRFAPLPTEEMIPLVAGIAEDDAQFLLRLAQGAPGVILSMKDDPDRLRSERQGYAAALHFWRSHSLGERLRHLQPLSERGEEAEQFLLHLALALREEQSASYPEQAMALRALTADLRTNASRPLLLQRFALAVSAE
ncbi:MAG: hypothetical protein WCS85_05485 [Candidatus Peribacteraceae bacterium]